MKILNHNKKAFTLIELLVVVAIIAALAAVVIINVNSARSNSKYTQTKADMKLYMTAVKVFFNDKGYYPNDAPYYPEALSGSYVGRPVNASSFVDGWGHAMDWDNWCGSGGGRGSSGTCPINSDADPGPIGVRSPGPSGSDSSDDITLGSRGYSTNNY